MEFYSQLLCTFSTMEGYKKDISSIIGSYNIIGRSIFVLQNLEDTREVFLTYNVEKTTNLRHYKTISVHRKKDFNVIYSINALNVLADRDNNPNREVDWSKYKNSIIINCDSGLKIVPTKLLTLYPVK